jgi:peroxiredoxin
MSAPALNALLDAYRGYTTADEDPAVSAAFRQEAEGMRNGAWLHRVARVGAVAPEVALPDSPDRRVCLSDLLCDGPLVLKFYRGRWCPYCTLDLRAWQRALPDLRALGAGLLTVSPQTETEVALSRERDRLGFQIVTDSGNAIARAFGVAYEVVPPIRRLYESADIHLDRVNDAAAWTLPLPAVFLIGTDRRIRWSHVEPDYRRRAEPGDVLARVAAMVR